jgi:hypothetical protein
MYLSSVTVTVSPRADVHVQFRDMVKHDRHSVDSIPRAISKKMHAFVLRLFLTPDPRKTRQGRRRGRVGPSLARGSVQAERAPNSSEDRSFQELKGWVGVVEL